jgi:protein-S-isoprenylcysteine O-methyltransferase Ste14
LKKPRFHGLYRFFAWEAILIQITINLPVWFAHPLSWYQLISWCFLCICIYLAVMGFYLLRTLGGSRPRNGDDANFAFENTANLVTKGVYHSIRHPLYSALLFLVWGAFFKLPSLPGFLITIAASAFLYTAAKAEEGENIHRFGSYYVEYMKTSKMFVPFIL